MTVPVVDEELCVGCGTCEALCPEVFKVGDDEVSHVIAGSDCTAAACCDEAAESCPEGAISLEG
jgi:ferredoxin